MNSMTNHLKFATAMADSDTMTPKMYSSRLPVSGPKMTAASASSVRPQPVKLIARFLAWFLARFMAILRIVEFSEYWSISCHKAGFLCHISDEFLEYGKESYGKAYVHGLFTGTDADRGGTKYYSELSVFWVYVVLEYRVGELENG